MKLKTIFFLALIVNVGFANGQKKPNVHGKFVGKLLLEPVGDGVHFRVAETYSYTDPEGHMLQADPGFSTDGASIPRALWTLIGSPLTGNYLFAAVIHDVGCDSHKYSWQITHRMFYDGMIDKGVGENYAKLLYWGVRFGGPKWKETTVTASSPADVKAKIAAQKGEQVGSISAAVADSKLGVPTNPTFEAKMRVSLPETPLNDQQVEAFRKELEQRKFTLDEIDARTPLDAQPQTRIFNNNGTNYGFQNNGDNNGTQTLDQSIHISEHPEPLSITAAQTDAVTAAVASFKGTKITIEWEKSTPETDVFAHSLGSALTAGGLEVTYTPSMIVMMPNGGRPTPGLSFVYPVGDNGLVTAIAAALHKSGFPTQEKGFSGFPIADGTGYVIVVGTP